MALHRNSDHVCAYMSLRSQHLAPEVRRAASYQSAARESNASKRSKRPKPKAGVFSDAESLASTALSTKDGTRRKGKKESKRSSLTKDMIRWMEKTGLQTYTVPLLLLFIFCIKLSVGLGSYSGEGNPPLYGDMEAQRNVSIVSFTSSTTI